MTEQQWWLLINKSPRDKELWEAFACWLQDEADKPLRAQAVWWKLAEDRWPRKDSKFEIWNWVNQTDISIYNDFSWRLCILPVCLFINLQPRNAIRNNMFSVYCTLNIAESALLDALEVCFNKGSLSLKEPVNVSV